MAFCLFFHFPKKRRKIENQIPGTRGMMGSRLSLGTASLPDCGLTLPHGDTRIRKKAK